MTQSLFRSHALRQGSPAAVAAAALLLATSAWGSLFFVGQHVLRDIDALWFTTIRYALAALVLLALQPAFGQAGPARTFQLAPRLLGYGLAGYGAFSVLVFIGVSLSIPSHGAVIMATMPVTTVLVRWVLDGIRPQPKSLAACVVALTGIAVVSGLLGAHHEKAGAGVLAGDLLALAGTLGWITYTRGTARFPELSPFDYSAVTAYAAAPMLVLVAVAASLLGIAHWPDRSSLARHAVEFAYVAALPTVAAVVAFNHGVRILGATTGTLFINFVPVSALFIATALGQAPSTRELAGAALVGMSLVIATRTR